jgi:hypothetical protein
VSSLIRQLATAAQNAEIKQPNRTKTHLKQNWYQHDVYAKWNFYISHILIKAKLIWVGSRKKQSGDETGHSSPWNTKANNACKSTSTPSHDL